MTNTYNIEKGNKVQGTYQGLKISGTVSHSRFNSCRADLMEVTVVLNNPINVFGEMRESVIVSCDVQTGQPVKGWGDSSITEVCK